MSDEATPSYMGLIDNYALGHDFLNKTFGIVPRIGYHIDPFGHSATMATLFADMGMDAFGLKKKKKKKSSCKFF